MLDPDFLTGRAIFDTVKLGIGVVYFGVVFLLCKKHGRAAVDRAFWIWAWTATALSVGSLAGVTGAIVIVPTDGYRSNGFFEDPNLYAGYLLVSFSIVLYLATISTSVVAADPGPADGRRHADDRLARRPGVARPARASSPSSCCARPGCAACSRASCRWGWDSWPSSC